MIWIIALLIISLVLAAVLFLWFTGLPDSRTAPGKRIRWTLIALMACLLISTGLSAMILLQENTGVETGLSGGLASDARKWVSRQSAMPPRKDQPGDNIRILREGLDFINGHPTLASSAEAQQVALRYSALPKTPTRLLTKQEENQYYEGAQSVFNLISGVASRDDTAP